jgi:hypothetical protein
MPIIDLDVRKYFTPKSVASALKTLPEMSTQIMDTIYTTKRQHPLPVLGVDEISKILQTVPVVRRGTAAVPIQGESRQIQYIEPQPIEASTFLDAVKLNNLKLLDNSGMQMWVNDEIADIRRTVRWTTEALAAQSLTGSISYPMKTNGGYDIYTVDFGTTLEYAPSVLWNDASISVAKILKDLIAISKLIKKQGYGRKIVWLAGSDVFIALADKILNLTAKNERFNATVTANSISIAGFEIGLVSGFYKDPQSGDTVDVLAANKLYAVAQDAPFTLYYCAIDDLDANLLPMPLYVMASKKTDPSGYKIIGKSKPLPVPVPKAICSAQCV